MNNIMAKVLPQEGGLQGTTAGAYNATIALLSTSSLADCCENIVLSFI